MRIRATAAIAVLLVTLTACASHARVDPAACKADLAAEFAAGMADEDSAPPASCDRVGDKELTKFASEVFIDYLGTEDGAEFMKSGSEDERTEQVFEVFDGIGATPPP
ncbi:hypothetical protein [Streptomyces niveus]|uniref:hypothetical protein n=1 Tax=Streptomyces niveus TaxID=193462 RepID=UPI0036D39DEA